MRNQHPVFRAKRQWARRWIESLNGEPPQSGIKDFLSPRERTEVRGNRA
jgi:hypothetical protein